MNKVMTYKLKSWVLFGIIAAIILLNFPGYMTLDSTSQLHQARTMILNDGHPPAMAIIWALLDKVIPGPVLMLFLNAILHVCGVWLMSGIFRAPWKRYLITILTILFIPTFFTIGVIWKDTLMNGFLLLAAGGIVQLVRIVIDKGRRRDLIKCIVFILVSLFLAISQRHNAPAGAVVLLCPVALVAFNALFKKRYFKKRSTQSEDEDMDSSLVLNWTRVFVAIVMAIVSVFILFLSSISFFDKFVTHHRNFWQVLAFYDLAAVSIEINENILPPDVYPKANLEVLQKHYSPYSVLSLTKDSGVFYYITKESDLDRLSTAWKTAIKTYPEAYISHRTAVYKEVLGTGTVHPWAPIIDEPTIESRKHLYTPEVAKFQKPLRKKIKDYVVRQDPFFYAPWFYYYLGFVAVIFLLAKWAFNRQLPVKDGLILCFVVSGIAYELSLFFVAPSPDFRYSSFMIFMSVFGCLALCFDFSLGRFKAQLLNKTKGKAQGAQYTD